MKYILTLVIFLFTLSSIAQIVTYNFSGAPGDQVSQTATSQDANLTASAITRGSGITAMTGSGSINSKGWTSSSQDATDYYEFTLTPTTGHQLNITSINLSAQRSGTGPGNYLVAYSIGGGTDATATSGTISTTLVDQSVSATLTIKTPLAVRFRIYAWGGSTAAGTFRLDNTLTVSGAAPLPVKLNSFTGKSVNNTIVLNWATSWEEKNEGFDILKSRTATNFEKVGFVEGHITSQELSTYTFTDTDVQEGQVYYYQLKQRDIGGDTELSKIIVVRAGLIAETVQSTVYPNPNPGSFTLSASDPAVTIIGLYNSSGFDIPVTISKDERQSSTNLSINPKFAIPAGIYYLRFRTNDGIPKQALKVIVQ